MFERFTERARKVVVHAQAEVRHFNHNYLGTEHLLLGLLREDEGVAAQALYSLNVTFDEVREQVESIVGYGEDVEVEQALFTPRSKKAVEMALREALQLGHNYIGTEHLLLGLVNVNVRKSTAVRVLSNLEVDPDMVRRQVVRRLGGGRSSQQRRRIEQERRARIRSALELEADQIPQGFKLRRTVHDDSQALIGRPTWSPDGQVLAASSDAGSIRFWNLESEERRTISRIVGRGNIS